MVRTGQLVMAWIKIPGQGGKMMVRAGLPLHGKDSEDREDDTVYLSEDKEIYLWRKTRNLIILGKGKLRYGRNRKS